LREKLLEEERYREWSRPREDMELDDLKVLQSFLRHSVVVSEMTYNVLMGTLNPAHSCTHSLMSCISMPMHAEQDIDMENLSICPSV